MVSLVIEYERALKKDIFVGSRLCTKNGALPARYCPIPCFGSLA